MEHLEANDLRAVLAAIRVLDAEDEPAFPRRVVAAARALVDCDQAGYYEMDAASGTLALAVSPDEDEAGGWPACGPPPLRLEPDADGPGAGTPPAEGHFRRLVVASGEHEHGLLVIGRQRADFSDSERARLDALLPYLAARRRSDGRVLALKQSLGLPRPEEEDCCGPRLSRREMEVMIWVARGKTNEEIALILGFSALTVKKHLEHVFAKLEVSNRTSAALCFAACGQGRVTD